MRTLEKIRNRISNLETQSGNGVQTNISTISDSELVERAGGILIRHGHPGAAIATADEICRMVKSVLAGAGIEPEATTPQRQSGGVGGT